MPRPGSVVTLLDTPSPVTLPTDTGTLFVTGLSDRGPTIPTLVLSLNDFITKFGARQTYSYLYDYLEAYFRVGGGQAYVSRVVGPAASSGTLNLLDTGMGISLVATAIGPGAWSANYKLVVYTASGGYGIRVQDLSANVLEDSGTLPDQASAIVWGRTSNYIRITLGATALNPDVMAATVLSTGADDRASITDAQWLNAQNLFISDLGPGQIAQCGRTSSTAHNQLTDHSENASFNRVALLDLVDSVSVGTLQGSKPTGSHRRAATFVPYVTIPGLSTSTGVSRLVPPSAVIAGLINRNDALVGPNAASAGANGIISYVNGLSQVAWNDTDRATLNTSGINVIRSMLGGIRVYGWRSLADPVNDLNWLDFGNGRQYMALAAELNEVAEGYMFDDINADSIGGLHDALVGVLLDHYNRGELFGDSAADAFAVDTGTSVNTPTTIANLELHATCYVRMSVFAEYIPIQVVKYQVNQTIPVISTQ